MADKEALGSEEPSGGGENCHGGQDSNPPALPSNSSSKQRQNLSPSPSTSSAKSGASEDQKPDMAAPPKPRSKPRKRRRSTSPMMEEDIIDGFAICSFKSLDELQSTVKAEEDKKKAQEEEAVAAAEAELAAKTRCVEPPTPVTTSTTPVSGPNSIPCPVSEPSAALDALQELASTPTLLTVPRPPTATMSRPGTPPKLVPSQPLRPGDYANLPPPPQGYLSTPNPADYGLASGYGSARTMPNNKLSPGKNRFIPHVKTGTLSPLSPKQKTLPSPGDKSKKEPKKNKAKPPEFLKNVEDIKKEINSSDVFLDPNKSLDPYALKLEPEDRRGMDLSMEHSARSPYLTQQMPQLSTDARMHKFEKPHCILKQPNKIPGKQPEEDVENKKPSSVPGNRPLLNGPLPDRAFPSHDRAFVNHDRAFANHDRLSGGSLISSSGRPTTGDISGRLSSEQASDVNSDTLLGSSNQLKPSHYNHLLHSPTVTSSSSVAPSSSLPLLSTSTPSHPITTHSTATRSSPAHSPSVIVINGSASNSSSAASTPRSTGTPHAPPHYHPKHRQSPSHHASPASLHHPHYHSSSSRAPTPGSTRSRSPTRSPHLHSGSSGTYREPPKPIPGLSGTRLDEHPAHRTDNASTTGPPAHRAFSRAHSWTGSTSHFSRPPHVSPGAPPASLNGPSPLGNSPYLPHLPTPPAHSSSGSMFGPMPPPATNPLALTGLQTNPLADPALASQDLLRQELNSRFLATQDRGMAAALGPPPYLRAEMHNHLHQHQHQHQHTHNYNIDRQNGGPGGLPGSSPAPLKPSNYPLAPPAQPHHSLAAEMDRERAERAAKVPGLGAYPGISPIVPPGLPGPLGLPVSAASSLTRNQLGLPGTGLPGAFQPKNQIPANMHHTQLLLSLRDREKAASAAQAGVVGGGPPTPAPSGPVKKGKWCAVHVQIAWEIYRHQQKQQADQNKGGDQVSAATPPRAADLLRPPGHPLGGFGLNRPDLPPSMLLPGVRSPFEAGPAQHPSSFLNPAHLGAFPRPNHYNSLPLNGSSGFGGLGSTMFAGGRDLPTVPGLTPPTEWNRLHRTPASFPTPPAWGKPEAEREKERERERDLAVREMRDRDRKSEDRERSQDRDRRQIESEYKDRSSSRSTPVSGGDFSRRTSTDERSREADRRPSTEDRPHSQRSRSRSPVIRNGPLQQDDAKAMDLKVKEERRESSFLDARRSSDNHKMETPPYNELIRSYPSSHFPPVSPLYMPPLDRTMELRKLHLEHEMRARMSVPSSMSMLEHDMLQRSRDRDALERLHKDSFERYHREREFQREREALIMDAAKASQLAALRDPFLQPGHPAYAGPRTSSPLVNSKAAGSPSTSAGVPPPLISSVVRSHSNSPTTPTSLASKTKPLARTPPPNATPNNKTVTADPVLKEATTKLEAAATNGHDLPPPAAQQAR